MPVPRALRRLLHVRELEEEQSRLALESALGELNRLQSALTVATERGRRGRQLVSASAQSGELPDRLAGLEESRSAVRLAKILAARVESAESEVAELRRDFLAQRVERRQAATLIQEMEARDAVAALRRTQQGLDEWHRSRSFQAGEKAR